MVGVQVAQKLLPTISLAETGTHLDAPIGSSAIWDTIFIEILSTKALCDTTSLLSPLSVQAWPQISDACVIYLTEEVRVEPLSSGERRPTAFDSGKSQILRYV